MNNQSSFRIEKLPFFWRVKDVTIDNNIIPGCLPFEFDFDESLQLIIQKRNDELLSNLHKVYLEESNVGCLQDKTEDINKYKLDFLKFIKYILKKHGSNVKTILEIGCGGCTILKDLQNIGFNVTGIDPSPIARLVAENLSFKVINDFYPTSFFKENVDLIFHSDVLEHVSDPVSFLKDQYNQLNDNGFLIIAVPDCTESIKTGDISMILHQHLNYFDIDSLINILHITGFEIRFLRQSEYCGQLYCFAIKSNVKNDVFKFDFDKYNQFIEKVKKNSSLFTTIINNLLQDNNKIIGFYCPLRAIPYLSLTNSNSNIRFFDDTPDWNHKTFDGINIKIENIKSLTENPLTDLFIMSLTFQDILYNLTSKIKGINNIYKIRDLLNA